MVDVEEQLRAYGDVLDAEPAHAIPRNRRPLLLAAAAVLVLVLVPVVIVASRGGDKRSTVAIEPTTTSVPVALPSAGLSVVDRFSFAEGENNALLAIAGGDVWLAGFQDRQPVIDRRDPRSGKLLARVKTPFAHGFGYMAVTDDAVYVNGMVSYAGPATGLIRIDTASNQVTASKNSSAACECPIAASAQGLWEQAPGAIVRRDPVSLEEVARTPLLSTPSAIAIVGDTVQVGGFDASVAVIDIATNQISATILPPERDKLTDLLIDAMSPRANENWMLRSNGSLATLVDEQPRLLIPVVPGAGISNATSNAIWVVGGNDVWGIPIAGDDDTIGRYSYDGKRFGSAAITTSEPGFVAAAAIGNELWLRRIDGGVIHAHVGT
jgi:hypothetical protein